MKFKARNGVGGGGVAADAGGGEQQRLALGRALSAKPKILCLNEPLGCLDKDSHEEVRDLLRRVCREVARGSWWGKPHPTR